MNVRVGEGTSSLNISWPLKDERPPVCVITATSRGSVHDPEEVMRMSSTPRLNSALATLDIAQTQAAYDALGEAIADMKRLRAEHRAAEA